MINQRESHERDKNEGLAEAQALSARRKLLLKVYNFMLTTYSPVMQNIFWYSSRSWLVVVSVLHAVQLVSLLPEREFDEPPYSLSKSFFRASRFELLVIEATTFETWATIQHVLVFFVAAVCFLTAMYPSKIHSVILSVLRFLTVCLCEVLILPGLLTCIATVLHPIASPDLLKLYQIGDSLGLSYYFAALTSGMIIVALAYVNIVGSAELRHFVSKQSVTARSTSRIEVRVLIFRICLLLCSVLKTHPNFLGCLLVLGEAYTAVLYAEWLPYYSHCANQLKIGTSVAVLTYAVGYLTGLYSDMNASVLFCVLGTPLILSAILLKYYPERVKKLQTFSENYEADSHFEFELKLRRYLLQQAPSDATMILTAFFKSLTQSKRGGQAMLAVWECNYCLYNLNATRLARIKLAKHSVCQFNFEASYQVFLCNKMLDFNEAECSSELNYIKYVLKMEQSKDLEQAIGEYFFRILSLFKAEASHTKILSLIDNLHHLIRKVARRYEKLVKAYPFCEELVASYQNFLSVVSKDQEKLANIQNLCIGLKNSKRGTQLANYFNEDLGIIIASGDTVNLGAIVHASNATCELLGADIKDIIGENIESIIPSPYNKHYSERIKQYLLACLDTHIPFPKYGIIKDFNGYLVEVTQSLQCVANETAPYFLGCFQRRDKSRDVLLVDEHLIIQGYTRNIEFQLDGTVAVGKHITEVFTDLDSEDFYPQCMLFSEQFSEVTLVYHEKRWLETVLRYIAVYNNDDAVCTFNIDCLRNAESFVDYSGIALINKPTYQQEGSQFVRARPRVRMSLDQQNDSEEPGPTFNLDALTHSSKSQNRNPKTYRIREKTVQFISLFKWAVVLQLLAIVAMASGWTIYMVGTPKISQSLEQIAEVILLRYYVAHLGSESRNYKLYQDDAALAEAFISSSLAAADYLADYENIKARTLESCPTLLGALSDQVSVWGNPDHSELYFIPLDDFFSSLVSSAHSLAHSDDPSSFVFLQANALSYAYKSTSDLKEELLNCLQGQLANYSNYTVIAALVEASVIMLLTAFLLYASLSIQKNTSALLQEIQGIVEAQKALLEVTLAEYLKALRRSVVISEESHPPGKRVPMNESKYWLRGLLLPVLFIGYLVLTYVRHYSLLAEAVNPRLSCIYWLGDSQAALVELEYWGHEELLGNSEVSLTLLLNPYPYLPAENAFELARDELKAQMRNLMTNRQSLSAEEQEELFFTREPWSLYSELLRTIEASYTYTDHAEFVATTHATATGLRNQYNLAVTYSKEQAEAAQLTLLLEKLGCFALMGLATWVLVFPMVAKEKEHLKHIVVFYKMIQ